MNLNFKSSHDGFVFTIPLMLAIGLIIFTAVIVITQVIVAVGGPLIPQLITEMPRFFDYDDTTGDLILDANGNPAPNERTELYFGLFVFSFIILIVIGVLSILVLLLESIRWVNPGTAWRLLRKVILFIPFFAVFPFLWDLWAITIQSTAMALLDFNGGGIDAATRTATLWQSMGGIIPPGAFDPAEWTAAFVDPGAFAQGIMKDVFLSLFKGFAVMFMTAMAFIISTIRIMLTMVFAMSIPLVLVLGLIPLFRKLKDLVVTNLVGLSMAPIFSALILTTGMAYLDSTTLPAMQDWFASLAVGFLAVFAPVILAPILGTLTTQVGQMMSTAIMGAAIVGSTAGQGALGGISNAANQMSGAAGQMAMMGGAAGASAIAGRGMTSGQIGTFTSGHAMSSGNNGGPMAFGEQPGNPIQQSPMSFGEKFKAYTKAGIMGGGAGIAAGGVQAATQAMHIPQVGRPIAGDILQTGNLKGAEIGQTGVVNHNLNFMDSYLKSLEPSGYDQVIEKTVIPQTGQNAPILMNPGTMVNEMDYVSTGHNIIENQSLQQEYLDMQHNQIKGFDRFNPNVQMKADSRLLEQLHEHPGSAGKMFESIKNSKNKISDNLGL
ncbi:MAG: hypothetical protein OEL81_01915 [Nitrosopumilus sp.]|nr:hypothetical protein [Nitrosopumilus sp.]